VETSAFNAEAPTEPAGETVGCRRQLGGIVLQDRKHNHNLVANAKSLRKNMIKEERYL